MTARIFAPSLVVTLVALVVAYLYLGWTGLALCAILGVLEVSLSFDNAVINATILERMSAFWQKMFLTVGVLIAVFGMRLLFPLVIVWITGGLNPVEALDLAMNPPPEGQTHFADGQPSYETILTEAHPQIAAFGGMFLQGTGRVVASYVPIMSVVAMPSRLAEGSAAWWEPVLSLAVTAAFAAATGGESDDLYKQAIEVVLRDEADDGDHDGTRTAQARTGRRCGVEEQVEPADRQRARHPTVVARLGPGRGPAAGRRRDALDRAANPASCT